jgi:chemotaxis protein MotA
MDFATFVGILIGLGGIIIGNRLEGGTIASLMQGTAFIIVFGGTFGAVLVSNRWRDIKTGFSLLHMCFAGDDHDEKRAIAEDVIMAARVSRKESLLGLEQKLKDIRNDYLKIVLRYVVDGVDAKSLRDVFETEIDHEERKLQAGAKIWADAGGYAPTIGIIGAVLGLIHVMSHLSDTSQLGRGIAVAFVATIYGVGSANLVFLPLANKMRRKIIALSEKKTLVLEGAISILSGTNPYLIDEKMRVLADAEPRTVEEVL